MKTSSIPEASVAYIKKEMLDAWEAVAKSHDIIENVQENIYYACTIPIVQSIHAARRLKENFYDEQQWRWNQGAGDDPITFSREEDMEMIRDLEPVVRACNLVLKGDINKRIEAVKGKMRDFEFIPMLVDNLSLLDK